MLSMKMILPPHRPSWALRQDFMELMDEDSRQFCWFCAFSVSKR